MNTSKIIETHIPKVYVAKELREISRDFTKPEEMVREAISNSLDAQSCNRAHYLGFGFSY